MELNWELCRIFYQVARCRNFSRAASMLFTSQPAVSRAMAALERELGCRLFIRNRRGVELTPEGKLFYAHVEAGCEQFRRGREEIAQAVGLQSGSVAIGASETALRVWAMSRLDRFHARYPGVTLRLYGGTSRQAMEELKSGAIDFAVAAMYGGGFRYLKETRLRSFRDVFVASRSFSFLKGRRVTLEELMRHPLICHKRGTLTFEFLEGLCKARGLELEPAMEPETSDLVLELARHGFGVGFLPEQAAEKALREGDVFVVQVAEELPSRSISLLEYEGHTLSLAARRLRDMLTEGAESEVSGGEEKEGLPGTAGSQRRDS